MILAAEELLCVRNGLPVFRPLLSADLRLPTFQSGPDRKELRLEGGLERGIRVVRAKEASVVDEETFFVVILVNEPIGDALQACADELAGLRLEEVNALHAHADVVLPGLLDVTLVFDAFEFLTFAARSETKSGA